MRDGCHAFGIVAGNVVAPLLLLLLLLLLRLCGQHHLLGSSGLLATGTSGLGRGSCHAGEDELLLTRSCLRHLHAWQGKAPLLEYKLTLLVVGGIGLQELRWCTRSPCGIRLLDDLELLLLWSHLTGRSPNGGHQLRSIGRLLVSQMLLLLQSVLLLLCRGHVAGLRRSRGNVGQVCGGLHRGHVLERQRSLLWWLLLLLLLRLLRTL